MLPTTLRMAGVALAPAIRRRGRALLRPAVWCLGLVLLVLAARQVEALARWPAAWVLPFNVWLNDLLRLVADQPVVGDSTIRDMTRGMAPVLSGPADFIDQLIRRGFQRGFGAQQEQILPPVSWASLCLLTVAAAWRRGGAGLGLLALATCAYLLLFNLWDSTLVTVSQLAVAVPLSLGLGFALGLLVDRFPAVEGAVFATLNQMQTIPLFAYLVPIIMFFGIGTAAGIIAVVVFAAPPMVRTTVQGLAEARARFGELSLAVGATPRQALWKILLPAAGASLRLGLNQVIMLAFATVILAALVGAEGIGYDVLVALQRLAIGRGLEAGLAITLVAILLDRYLQALARGQRPQALAGRWFWPVIAGLALVPVALSLTLDTFALYPRAWTLTTAKTTDAAVDYLVEIAYAPIEAIQYGLVVHLLIPLKAALLGLPWAAVAVVVAVASWRAAGVARAIVLGGLVALIAATGFWDKAMLTFYLCLTGVAAASLVGFPLGIMAARLPRLGQWILPVVDTLQTLPAFIYLIPVIMLFGTGDMPCIMAIATFALCPAVRYTESALRNLPASFAEVGRQFGATPLQRLVKIDLPAALPALLLGLAQVVLMALAMVVVTALIGTTDLGHLIMIAVSRADPGQALAAGICIAVIGIIADRLLTDQAHRITRLRGSSR